MRFPDGQQGCSMEIAWYLTGLASSCLSVTPIFLDKWSRWLLRERSLSQIVAHRGSMATLPEASLPRPTLGERSGALPIRFTRQLPLLKCLVLLRMPRLARWRYAQHEPSANCRPLWANGAGITTLSTGRVVNRYPVFSVHQHAMGPMMLFAAADASGFDFSEAIYKGLAWIGGQNELGFDFVDKLTESHLALPVSGARGGISGHNPSRLKLRRGEANGRPRFGTNAGLTNLDGSCTRLLPNNTARRAPPTSESVPTPMTPRVNCRGVEFQ